MSYLALSRGIALAGTLALALIGSGGRATAASPPVVDRTSLQQQQVQAQQQDRGFWTAQVSWPTANLHAQPNAGSAIRRVANEGDLVRVAGRTQGIDGDGGEWWSTTDGYVAVDGLL